MYVLVYASESGCFVRTVLPSWFLVCSDWSTVRCQAAGSTMPIPFGDGQISLFTSFICQSWWLAPSLEPLATTMCRHFSGLSRQYAQPLMLASTDFTVPSW